MITDVGFLFSWMSKAQTLKNNFLMTIYNLKNDKAVGVIKQRRHLPNTVIAFSLWSNSGGCSWGRLGVCELRSSLFVDVIINYPWCLAGARLADKQTISPWCCRYWNKIAAEVNSGAIVLRTIRSVETGRQNISIKFLEISSSYSSSTKTACSRDQDAF